MTATAMREIVVVEELRISPAGPLRIAPGGVVQFSLHRGTDTGATTDEIGSKNGTRSGCGAVGTAITLPCNHFSWATGLWASPRAVYGHF